MNPSDFQYVALVCLLVVIWAKIPRKEEIAKEVLKRLKDAEKLK